jgi:hypothetical protein
MSSEQRRGWAGFGHRMLGRQCPCPAAWRVGCRRRCSVIGAVPTICFHVRVRPQCNNVAREWRGREPSVELQVHIEALLRTCHERSPTQQACPHVCHNQYNDLKTTACSGPGSAGALDARIKAGVRSSTPGCRATCSQIIGARLQPFPVVTPPNYAEVFSVVIACGIQSHSR